MKKGKAYRKEWTTAERIIKGIEECRVLKTELDGEVTCLLPLMYFVKEVDCGCNDNCCVEEEQLLAIRENDEDESNYLSLSLDDLTDAILLYREFDPEPFIDDVYDEEYIRSKEGYVVVNSIADNEDLDNLEDDEDLCESCSHWDDCEGCTDDGLEDEDESPVSITPPGDASTIARVRCKDCTASMMEGNEDNFKKVVMELWVEKDVKMVCEECGKDITDGE